jgi:hypothetical protein
VLDALLLDDIWNDIGFVPVYSGVVFVQFDGTLFVIGSDIQADTLNINAAPESGRRNATDCKSARATSVFYKLLNNEHPVPAGHSNYHLWLLPLFQLFPYRKLKCPLIRYQVAST